MISLGDIQFGYEYWAAKPHNAKWVRKIDGTPIPNDLPVSIFMYLKESGLLDPPAPSVAVKALEWTKQPNMPDTYVWASSVFGTYRINPVGREAFELLLFNTDPFPRCGSMDEAKAAAQTHHDARIRSALSSQVHDVAEDAQILKAWKLLRELEGKLPHALGMIIGDALDELRPVIARIQSAAPAKQEGGE